MLVDTHVLLWTLFEPERLSASAYDLLGSSENLVLFSAASIWEISIKIGTGRLNLVATAEQILAAALELGFEELPVRARTTLRVATLPMHHRDPFDRLLVAQAMDEPATLLTADAMLARYSELVSIVTPR